jgi:methylated-DNA-[protein]-cysteine S-methyltransferase
MFPVGEKIEDLANCLFLQFLGPHFAIDGYIGMVAYPLSSSERMSFRTKAGKVYKRSFSLNDAINLTFLTKRVTPHQWAVYDYVRTIPCGKVTTYQGVALALRQGSPRSVGGALRNNPFAPFVPCHRIVASNFFVGGFFGEWGVGGETDSQGKRKIEMLAKEGVEFTKDGYVVDQQQVVWRG